VKSSLKLCFTTFFLLLVFIPAMMRADTVIACFIKNELSTYLSGDIAMSGVTPELWIEDDARLAEAEQIKKDWQIPVTGTAWTCPKCGEKQEPQFTSCWKCGTPRP
jgi:hypothetical protein